MTAKYTVVLVRHGESEYNKENRFCGWYDADLSATGLEEAKNAGKVSQEITHTNDRPARAFCQSDAVIVSFNYAKLSLHTLYKNEQH